jgi:hypothetical protein
MEHNVFSVLPLDLLLGQMNPVFTLTDYFFDLYHTEIGGLNSCTAGLPMQNLTLEF